MTRADPSENEDRTDENDERGTSDLRLGRRNVVKLAGVAAVPLAYSGTVSAGSGYGNGGYGEGGYGGTSDSAVAVSTGSASDVTADGATLSGDLTDLGGASSADVAFQYRRSDASTWQSTGGTTLSSTGSFSEQVSGLDSGTSYDYRATATASDGDTDTGSIKTFTTGNAADSAPSINRFDVSEAGRPDPHATITVVWDVADADADLETVAIDVVDGGGSTVRSVTWTVDGASASDVDEFEIRNGGGTDYEVGMTVTDAAGNTASDSSVVSA